MDASQKIGIYSPLEKVKEEKHFAVYIAYSPTRQQLVKLKLFSSEKTRDPLFYDNLRKIYQIQERLGHPGLEKPLEVFLHNGHPVAVFPLERGMYLDQMLRMDPPDLKKRLTNLKELGQILLFLEKEGILHGQIASSSVYIQQDGRVKLENMGIIPLVEGPSEDPEANAFMKLIKEVLYTPFAKTEEREKARNILEQFSPPYTRVQEVLRILQEKGPFSFDPLPVTSKPPAAPVKPLRPAEKPRLSPRRTRQLLTCSGFLLLTFFLFVILAYFLSLFFRPVLADVRVPNLKGKTYAQAQEILKKRKLSITLQGRQFNPEYAQGKVIYQSPEPDMRVKQGRVIGVVVSRGKKMLQLPMLIGKTADEAKNSLQRLGLHWVIQQVAREDTPEGRIAEQKPDPGAKVSKGEKVYLRVAKKPEHPKVTVPDLLGKKLSTARQLILKAHLTLASIARRYSEKDENTVLQQHPPAGETLESGGKVDLVVSKGPAPAVQNAPESQPSAPKEEIRSAFVDIDIPKGAPSQTLEIIVTDKNGKHSFYKKKHHGGESVSISVQGRGKSEVEVFFGGKLIRRESL